MNNIMEFIITYQNTPIYDIYFQMIIYTCLILSDRTKRSARYLNTNGKISINIMQLEYS